MTDWVDLLDQWKHLRDRANELGDRMSEEAGVGGDYDEDEYIARMDVFLDQMRVVECAIVSADPSAPGAQAVQLQFLIENWSEQAPLEPRWRALLEGLAAALVLTPVPIHPSDAARAA